VKRKKTTLVMATDKKDVSASVNKVLAEVDKFVETNVLSKSQLAQDLVKKSQIRPSFIVAALLLFLSLFVIFGLGASPLCNLVGFVYPLYASCRALKSEGTKDDQLWLTYWIVYGFFGLVESLTDFFLYWIPMYFLVKVAFLIYCFHPNTEGARHVYTIVIQPLFDKLEAHVGPVVDKAAETANKVVTEASAQVQKKLE